MEWLLILAILLVGIVFFLFFNKKRMEAFVDTGDFYKKQDEYTTEQYNYFDLIDKAVPVNNELGITDSRYNNAFRKVRKSPDQDYSKLFIQDDNKFQERDYAFCRNAVHPSNLTRLPRATIGCGWWFKEEGTSIGALGTVDGPIDRALTGGTWIWGLHEAAKLEDIKNCRHVTHCSLIDQKNNGGLKCGFCVDTGKGVPVKVDGTPKYNSDEVSCGSSLIVTASMCPSPAAIPSTTAIQYDVNGNPVGTTQTPGTIPRDICDLDASGNLSRECLTSIAITHGITTGGAILRLIRNASAKTDMDTYALIKIGENSNPVLNTIFQTGGTTVDSAGTVFTGIRSKINNSDQQIANAAKYLCEGLAGYKVCEFNDNDQGPFPTICLQREFRKAGCQPSGEEAPTQRSAAKYANMTFGAVRQEFRNIFTAMTTSPSKNAQNQAMMKCLGTELYTKRAEICDESGIEYLVYTRKSNGTTGAFVGRFISKKGLVARRWGWDIQTAVEALVNKIPGQKVYTIRTFATLPASTSMAIQGNVPANSAEIYVNGSKQTRTNAVASQGMTQTNWTFTVAPRIRNKIEIINGEATTSVGYVDRWRYMAENLDRFQLKQDSWRPVIALDFFRGVLADHNEVVKLKPNSQVTIADMGGKRCASFSQGRGFIEFENGIHTDNLGTITIMYYANSGGNEKSLFIGESRTQNPSSSFSIGNPEGKVSFIHASYTSTGQRGTVRQGRCATGMFEYGSSEGGFCCPVTPTGFSVTRGDLDICPTTTANGRTLCALDSSKTQGNPVCTGVNTGDSQKYWRPKDNNGVDDIPIDRPTGRWIHLSFVIFNDRKGVDIYENGVMIKSFGSNTSIETAILDTVKIGDGLNGGIAWFHIYNYKLTPEEIKRDMNYDNNSYEMTPVPLEDPDLIWDKYVNMPGQDFPGNDFRTITDTKSVRECAQMCHDEPTCITYQYNGLNKNCHLKNKLGPRVDTIPQANAGLFVKRPVTIHPSSKTNYVFDVLGFNRDNNAAVGMWFRNGYQNQNWLLRSDGQIQSDFSGKCLTVRDINTANYTPIVQSDCNGEPHQKFTIDSQSRLHPEHAPQKCVDIHGGDFNTNANGGRLLLWECHDGPNQRFDLKV